MAAPDGKSTRQDPAAAAERKKRGRSVVCALTMALKTSRLYSFAHQNVTAALKELFDHLGQSILEEGNCVLSRSQETLFLNDVRIRADFVSNQSLEHVLAVMKERDVGSIRFESGLEKRELESLITLLNTQLLEGQEPWDAFQSSCAKASLTHLKFGRHQTGEVGGGEDDDGKDIVMGAYFKMIETMGFTLDAVEASKAMDLRQLRHDVQTIVDITMDDPRTLLCLANVKRCGKPGANHAVNVAVLAVALGARLGLSKKLLGDLCLAALLHDVGKAKLAEALRATSALDVPAEDEKPFREHVHSGVSCLLAERLRDSVVKCISVVFLHHYRFDRTGFPKLREAREQDLFTRIVAICDRYDNGTTACPPTRSAEAPEVALRVLMEGGGTEFDPIVVKAFMNLMGLYPVGCLVRLDSGEAGTVVAPPADPMYIDRPTVKLFSDAQGNAVAGIANLLDRDASGNFTRTIVQVVHREEANLELEEYLTVI